MSTPPDDPGAGHTNDGGVPRRAVRAVLLAPWTRQRTAQLAQLYAYCGYHGLVVDSVAASLEDALEAITAGLADVVLVADPAPLAPLIEIASLSPPPSPPDGAPMRRRPRLIR